MKEKLNTKQREQTREKNHLSIMIEERTKEVQKFSEKMKMIEKIQGVLEQQMNDALEVSRNLNKKKKTCEVF